MILGLDQGRYKTSPEHLIVPKNEKLHPLSPKKKRKIAACQKNTEVKL